MKKFYIASQAPVIEMPVTSEKDAEGKSYTSIIGFRRYKGSEAQNKIESFKDLDENQATDLLKSEIVYIKDAIASVYDDETFELVETVKIPDTRKAKVLEPFWQDAGECLAVLTEHYLDSIPWKGSIIQAYIKSLYNLDFKEAEQKN